MRYYFTYIFSLLVLICGAQGFRTRYYPQGSQTNLSKVIFETTPGNYIAGGMTVDTTNGGYSNKLCIMGLNSQGQIQWTKKYGSHRFHYLNNVLITRSYYKQGNNMYYTGCVKDSTTKYIGVLIKFDANGDTLWQKIYRDPDPLEDVIPQMVTRSVDGGFLITGFFQNWSSNPYSKCLLIKTDINGNELWRKKIAKINPNVQDGKAIVQDAATKKIAIAGYQYPSSVNTFDNLVVVDSLGNLPIRSLYTPNGGVLVDMIQGHDGKIVAVGIISSLQTVGGNNLQKPFIVKFDINTPSNIIWQRLDLDKLVLNNAFTCIRELPNEDLLIGGLLDTMQLNNLPTNCLTRITRMDKNGNIIWNNYYDYKINAPESDNNLTIKAIELTSDGGWLTAIEGTSFPSPNPFFFVKYDSNGCDSTLAYCARVAAGIDETKATGYNITVYPNPTNGTVNVDVEDGMGLTAAVFDLSGREIKHVALTTRSFDIKSLNNGMYLLKVSNSDHKVLYQGRLVKE